MEIQEIKIDKDRNSGADKKFENRTVVLVLGMHRGGTSSISGLINQIGISLPENLLGSAPENAKGFFESTRVLDFHNELIAEMGLNWHSLEEFRVENQPSLSETFKDEIRAFLFDELENKKTLVVKDPRISKLSTAWLEVLSEFRINVVPVIVVRHPFEVAASLNERNGFSFGRSIALWLQHLLSAEAATRHYNRIFVNYRAVLDDWRPFAEEFSKRVTGVKIKSIDQMIGAQTFLSQSLLHHQFKDKDFTQNLALPEFARSTFETLDRASKEFSEPEPKILDKARSLFAQSHHLFAPALNDIISEKKLAQSKLADLEAVESGLRGEFSAEQTRALQLENQVQALQEQLSQEEETATSLRLEISGLAHELKSSKSENLRNKVALDQHIASLKENRVALDQHIASLKENRVAFKAEQERAIQLENMVANADRRTEYAETRASEQSSKLQRRIGELTALSENSMKDAQALRATITELKESSSWKLTAPLRRVKTLIAARGRKSQPVPYNARKSSSTAKDKDTPSGRFLGEPIRATIDESLLNHSTSIQTAEPIDIIIPVYRGLETTRACIESAMDASYLRPVEFVILDDCSPEPEVSEYIDSLSGMDRVTVLQNPTNLGFVGTVNRGMRLNPARDVVLLNSDTRVSNDWLDRMAVAAYSAPKIASVTPFSNNATICSYPAYCQDNELPAGYSVAELDDVFAEANSGETMQIPTAVGFCMYIRRDCLEAVGLFDEEAFGKGYGEENDFCMRASEAGWTSVLAADVFVLHEGGVSFKDTAKKQQEMASAIIRERWPEYFELVAKHVARDDERQFREAATARRYRLDERPVILLITHRYGGGIERHINDLKAMLSGQALFLTMRPDDDGAVLIQSTEEDSIRIVIDPKAQMKQLLQRLGEFGVERVHIHHTLGFSFNLQSMIADLDVPFETTLHDYFAICPRIHLGGTIGEYCGEPEPSGCNACISRDVPAFDRTIDVWRNEQKWMLSSAERVIAPSFDTADRVLKYHPEVDIKVVPHVTSMDTSAPINVPSLSNRQRLKVLVLGVIASHKGLSKLQGAVEISDKQDANIEFHLLGRLEGGQINSGRFIDHLTYQEDELLAQIDEIAPHIIWFPALVPETFSYTLDVALGLGLPVVAVNLGAFAERLQNRPWSWVLDWDTRPEDYVGFFESTRQSAFLNGRSPEFETSDLPEPKQENHYELDYAPSAQFAAARRSERKKIIVVSEQKDTTACGQIRIHLPFSHPSLAHQFEMQVLPVQEALKTKADGILVQRVAITQPEEARLLIDHCDRNGIKKIYEIDDDLFALPVHHPEKHIYDRLMRAPRIFAEEADSIITTTDALAERLRPINPNSQVVPNFLDDRIWFNNEIGLPQSVPDDGNVSIGLIGTRTHQRDFDLIAPALERINSKYANRVAINTIGFSALGTDYSWATQITPPEAIAGDYARFVYWLRRRSRWHIGLAPLEASSFNACKSPLKFLDYSALGMAGVYSKGAPFSNAVNDGETGYLVDNTPTAWFDVISELIEDEVGRLSIAQAARSEVRLRHTLAANSAFLREAWAAILT